MPWYQWVTILGIPSVISGLFMLVLNRQLARRDAARKKEDEEKERLRIKAEHEKAARDQALADQTAAVEAQNKALMAGVQALLRDRLLQGYRQFFGKGWADYDDRENLENIWRQYHDLGANGVMDGYRKKFLELPLVNDKGMEV